MAATGDQTERECPLCMEQLELDDLNFYPCTCEYQICRFCWHRIRTDENCLCPACRKPYPEDPVNFKPLSAEELQKVKTEKKLKEQQKKQKVAENRKHLANLRVVQKNLVFVVGLPPRLATVDILKQDEYFGKFGRIQKIMVNTQSTYVGSQGPSASAYITYYRPEEALRAIQGINSMNSGEGKSLKASLGTTKYCSHFLKNQPCAKPDCMYLHEVGDMEASFTKDDMQQGKHTDYERRLISQIKTSLDLQNGHAGGHSEETTPEPVQPVAASNNLPVQQNLPPRYARQQANRNRNRSRQNKNNKSRSPPSTGGDNHSRSVRQSSGSSRTSSSGGPSPTGHHNGIAPTGSGPKNSVVHPLLAVKPKPTPLLNLAVQHPFHNGREMPPPLPVYEAASPPPAASHRPQSSPRRAGRGRGPPKAPVISPQGPRDHVAPVVLSPDELTVDTTGTDWQAAFGFDSRPVQTQSQNHDDDLGFDPFAESCKGLAPLLDEEKRAAHCSTNDVSDPLLRLFRTTHLYENRMVMNGRQMIGMPPHPHYQQNPHFRPPFPVGPHRVAPPGAQMPSGNHAPRSARPPLMRHALHCDSSVSPRHNLPHNVPTPSAVSPFWLGENAFAHPVFSEAGPAGWPVNGSLPQPGSSLS